MSRPLWFLSLCIALAAVPAHARWRVEARPLDTRPYTREIKPLFVMHAKSGLSHMEGLGLELAQGSTVLFDIALPQDARPRQLELSLGYLTPEQAPGEGPSCAVSLLVEAGEPRQVDVTVPLRSIEPASIPFEKIRARYDYLTPQVEVPLPTGATRLKVTARVDGACTAGRLVMMDPKVWRRESDEKPRRLIFFPSDSIAGEWFDQGRRFMPFLQDYFSRPGARISHDVISVGTSTHDTTNVVNRLAYELRDGKSQIIPPLEPGLEGQIGTTPLGQGLVPAFLEAGYDVPGFNSNILFSSLWRPAGFRYFFDLELKGEQVNDRHVEVLTGMMVDWLKRHPDHDVFLYTWLSTTHVKGTSPFLRPDFPAHQIPKGVPAHTRAWVDQLARSLSYTDAVLEKFLQEPLVEEADLFFFSDHGLNWETLERPKPLWGRCVRKEAPANWHVELQEIRVVAAMRVHGYDPGPLPFETSLIDWVYSVLKHHNPQLPLETFAGKDLNEARPEDPLVVVSHAYRGAIRMNREHFYYEDQCEQSPGILFLDSQKRPVSPETAVRLVQALASRDMLLAPYRALTVEAFPGSAECQVELKLPAALYKDGSPAPARLPLDPTRWYTRLELIVPTVPSPAPEGLVIESNPPGCAELQAGYVRHRLPGEFRLAHSGFEPLIHLLGPDVTPGAATVIRPFSREETYTRKGAAFTSQHPAQPAQLPMSKELRAAMKRWGYIQDDKAKH